MRAAGIWTRFCRPGYVASDRHRGTQDVEAEFPSARRSIRPLRILHEAAGGALARRYLPHAAVGDCLLVGACGSGADGGGTKPPSLFQTTFDDVKLPRRRPGVHWINSSILLRTLLLVRPEMA